MVYFTPLSLDQKNIYERIYMEPDYKYKVYLNVGHHKPSGDIGAQNKTYKTNEYEYNIKFVHDVLKFIDYDVDVVIGSHPWKHITKKVNAEKPDFCISFHANAFNGEATGSEVLYFHTSQISKDIAREFLFATVDTLELPNRGVKGVQMGDRGSKLLLYTTMPCVLLEPFFIDNDDDYERAMEKREEHCMAIAKVINNLDQFLPNKK